MKIIKNYIMVAKRKGLLLLACLIILLLSLPAYGLHVSQLEAIDARNLIFLSAADRTELLVLYRAEQLSDIPIYGQLLDFIEPYRKQNAEVMPIAVGRSARDGARFLTHAPAWDLHHWLSYKEYQELSTLLRDRGIDLCDVKDLPFMVIIAPGRRVTGQWQGIQNLSKVRTALVALGFSTAEVRQSNNSDGAEFVKKTEPIFQAKLTPEQNEMKLVADHFEASGFMNKQMQAYEAKIALRNITPNMQKESWFIAEVSGRNDACGTYYLVEINAQSNSYKHIYCITNNEAQLISSRSKMLETIEAFIDGLYKKNTRSLSKQSIMQSMKSEGERGGLNFMILALVSDLPEKDYDKKGLFMELNKTIEKKHMMEEIGGFLRLSAQ